MNKDSSKLSAKHVDCGHAFQWAVGSSSAFKVYKLFLRCEELLTLRENTDINPLFQSLHIPKSGQRSKF